MAVEVPPPTARRASGARERILDSAAVLFYDSGIRAVGVDRLIAAASVTKATFYKYFESKDALVLEYLAARSADERTRLTHVRDSAASAREALRAIVDDAIAEISAPGFRGSAFVNAAVEFAESEHPVRQLIVDHRDWCSEVFASLLRDCGHPLPGDGADDLQLAWDGALVGGHIGDAVGACASLSRSLERVLDAAAARA